MIDRAGIGVTTQAEPTVDSLLSTLRQIKAFIFDWNGVLVLDEPLHLSAFARLCQESTSRALDFDEYSKHCLGRTDQEGVRNLLKSGWLSGSLSELVDRKRNLYRNAIAANGDVLAKGADKLLQHLAKSSTPYRIVTASAIEDVAAVRKRCSITGLLSDDLLRTEIPSSDRYRGLAATLRDLGTSPSDTLLIDDSEQNVKLGNQLGLTTLLIRTGRKPAATEATLTMHEIGDVNRLLRLE